MNKQGREKHAITDLCGNIKNQFRDAKLSILWEVTYFTLGIFFVLIQSNIDIAPLFFSQQFVAYVEGGCKKNMALNRNTAW
jgi:hypothetical protein